MVHILVKQVIDSIERGCEPYGLDALIALSKVKFIRHMDWLPLPRTCVLLLCHIAVSQGRKSYTMHDQFGWGSATFFETQGELICLWPLYCLIDALVFGALFFSLGGH